MTSELPPSPKQPSAPAADAMVSREVITKLDPNDVIFGRGSATSSYIGNKRFREITKQRREEYKQASQNKQKKQIAQEVYDYIHSLGGRFLRLADATEEDEAEFSFEHGKWVEVEKNAALEKIKQACRENRDKVTNKDAATRRSDQQELEMEEALRLSYFGLSNMASPGFLQTDPVFPSMTPVLPSSMLLGRTTGAVDPRLLILQQVQASMELQSFLQQQSATSASILSPAPLAMVPAYDSYMNPPSGSLHSSLPDNVPPQVVFQDPRLQANLSMQPHLHDFRAMKANTVGGAKAADIPSANDVVPTTDSDREDALLALSALKMANEPKFTEQELELEQRTTTDEERAEILSDMFGKFCTVDGASRPDKRARRDLDNDSISFLLAFMKGEIQRIPNEEKTALLEALVKCDHSVEFSDARLEHFLRVEGMNAKLAARRFVNYWQARQEVFGGKFVLPMTLGGALRDDLAALEATTYFVLPQADESGRPLLFSVPHSRGGKGLSTQSLLRLFWYAVEVISQENTDVSRGYVQLVWNKDASVWDYDIQGYKRMTYFQRSCWPAKVVATHVCCSPRSSLQIVKPVVFAFMKKGARSRSIMHDVPEDAIVEVLSHYGIFKNILPTEMGGSLEMNQADWLAHRRAVELEEI